MTPEEQRFWERCTFRQFAVLMLRLQALWLFFNALVEATYLPRYFTRWRQVSRFAPLTSDTQHELAWHVFRVILHVAAGLLIIQHAPKLLNWLIRDWLPTQPEETPEQPAQRP